MLLPQKRKKTVLDKEKLLLLLCKYVSIRMYNRVIGKQLERQTNQVCAFKNYEWHVKNLLKTKKKKQKVPQKKVDGSSEARDWKFKHKRVQKTLKK